MTTSLLAEHEVHMRAAGCAPTTIDKRLRLLRRLDAHLRLGLLFGTSAEIEAFLSRLTRGGHGLGRWSLANDFMHLAGFYGWADAVGYLDGNPMLKLRRPRHGRFAPKPCTPEQIAMAFTAPEPWLSVFALAYYEGMRCKEIAACLREQITVETVRIASAKGGDPQTVPTHPTVWQLVADRPDGPLFIRPDGRQADAGWISQGARRQFARMGLRGVHVHQLRHTLATHLLISGVDIRTVQEILRHANLNTTAAYTEVTDARKRAALHGLPALGAPASL